MSATGHSLFVYLSSVLCLAVVAASAAAGAPGAASRVSAPQFVSAGPSLPVDVERTHPNPSPPPAVERAFLERSAWLT